MKKLLAIGIVLVLGLSALPLAAQPVMADPGDIYVPGDYPTIQQAINVATSGDTVHVASGTYSENITLKSAVIVQGAGANVTTIDGSTARGGLPAYHVVVDADNATLDGFTITGGNASGTGNNGKGGGIYNGESSSPTVTNCTFSSNSAVNGGGGMYNHDASPATVTNCVFYNNSSTRGWGGGMHNHKSSPTVTNCTLTGNSGGGMLNWDSSANVTNCIFWDNGYEISNDATSTPLVTYSDVQAGYSGVGNIDTDPLFLNPGAGDYHLQAGSPCTDNGTDVGAPTEDIEGTPRPLDGDKDGAATTDMGAYEYVPLITALEATVDFDPDTLNLKSKGKWVTTYIELPAGYDVGDIDVITILLNDSVSAGAKPIAIGDYDGDGVPDLMVKFDRSDVQDVLEPADEVEVVVSGALTDGTPFEATDTIRVIEEGKN